MTTDRFHKASKDGKLDVLKEATKRDCNRQDEQGMTPTLYAAFNGNLDALRLLCGRQGDPDRADIFGNTALHLAAAQGHKHIVTFLVNFGVNIYATNIEGRTAQEVAWSNHREDILRFLDGIRAKLEASDKKKAKAMKEKATKESEKRIKKYNEQQALKMHTQKKLEEPVTKGHRSWIKKTIQKSESMSNLANISPQQPQPSISTIVGGGTVKSKNMGTVQRKKLACWSNNNDFKVSHIENGQHTVRSLRGIKKNSEVLYTGTITNSKTKRGQLDGLFNEDNIHQEPTSIFVRPKFGSIAFRKSIRNTFQNLYGGEGTNEESSTSLGESHGQRTMHSIDSKDELSDTESSEELERFWTAEY